MDKPESVVLVSGLGGALISALLSFVTCNDPVMQSASLIDGDHYFN
jgi:hypothetical protein